MNSDSRLATPSGARDDSPPFDRLIAVHRRNGRGMVAYGILLLLAGVAFIVMGWNGTLPWMVGLITGIMTFFVAIFPYREALERDERMEGLQILSDEWHELTRGRSPTTQEKDQFGGLLHRLYSSDKSVG